MMRSRLFFLFSLLLSCLAGDAAVGKLVENNLRLNSGESWSCNADSAQSWTNIELRCKIRGQNNFTNKPLGWSLLLYGVGDCQRQSEIRVNLIPSLLGDEFSVPQLEISVEDLSSLGDTKVTDSSDWLTSKIEGNTLSLALNKFGDNNLEVWYGNRQLSNLGVIALECDIRKIEVKATTQIEIESVNIKSEKRTIIEQFDGIDEQSLSTYFRNSIDTHEGIYEYLDSDINTAQSRLGGFYRLALLKNESGGYDVIYLGGAQENSRNWIEGMIKGKLSPTIFQNHYNLTWTDSAMNDDMTELSAELTGSIMVLHFPKERAIIRFSREK